MNLNKILALGLLAGCSAAAMAVPARPGLRTYQQPDGSEITLTLVGDEHFHTFLTTDGLTVERGEDGTFYYLTTEGLTDIAVHNPTMRQFAEKAFVKSISAKADLEALLEVNEESIAAMRASTVPTRAGKTQVPNTGSPRVPILLVEYKDVKFKDADPLATFKEFFLTGEASARRYFEDQSNGKFTPQFDVYGPVTLSSNRRVYGANQGGTPGKDVGVGKMVAEAVKALDSEIEYSLYDNDKDGECDVMIILYAGDGENSSPSRDAANAIWPCQWSLSGSDYGLPLNCDRTVINKFAVFNELSGFDLKKIDGIGTFCHEFSHCLGLPDFYDTNYRYFGMGMWSLMDTGSYNNKCYTPCGYSAYEKAFMGWIDIEEGVRGTHYTLPVFNSKDASKDIAVRLTNDRDPDEYFILENRRLQGWDSYMPAEGLFIYHVTYDADVWSKNEVNKKAVQRMT
ncbi:MAG: M6 family metalloprotease domain-containing protein, partial [Muribaculaceae bacterium]|nr:M6 family metalloprotease domain-containing protein [Muribaculaceae bacterium]